MKTYRLILVTLWTFASVSVILPQEVEEISAASILEKVMEDSGVEAVKEKFNEILQDRSEKFFIDEKEMDDLGYKYIYKNEYSEGLNILKLNTLAFPNSANAFSKLGQVYEWIGYETQAEENLRKAFELDPDNLVARKGLSRLNGGRFDIKNQTQIEDAYLCGENTNINQPYFGMEPPGIEPVLFAPGIISTRDNFEFACTFSPDGKEFYFTRRGDNDGNNVIMVSRWAAGGWLAPDTLKISGQGFWDNEPHITRDGEKFYFGSLRIKPGEVEPEYGIWKMEKTESGWSDPGFFINGMYVSTGNSGSVYVTDISGGMGLVKYSFDGHNSFDPVALTGGPNDPVLGVHPCIAPDESYIIFDCYRDDSFGGEGDLYVSFNNGDGTWSDAINLGAKINGPGTEFCASISPDGKYIFYAKNRDIYWVSSEIINNLKPSE